MNDISSAWHHLPTRSSGISIRMAAVPQTFKAPENITLMSLPPRAPVLIPCESIWQFMRANWLSNRIFKAFDDIVDHCCYAWNTRIDQPWKIMSIAGARSFEKADCDRIARAWPAGLRVTGEHREGSDTSAANEGAMAVLAKGVCLAFVTRST